MKPGTALVLCAALTLFSVAVFSYALGLPFPALFGPWLPFRYGHRRMDLLHNLALGFATALSPGNIFYCFIGTLLGTLIGVLPGIGAPATIAMLLPITFTMEPSSALIMLAGIFYGAQYGGSTTAILVNLPGESSSVVTAIDGYQMARQGRAGPALADAAIGSFVAGTISTLLIALFAPPLTMIALKFGSAEYFSLILLGLIVSVALAHGSVIKALAMIVLGLLLGTIGTDIYTGTPRFSFGFLELADGIEIVPLAVGLFGIAEMLRNLENESTREVSVRKCPASCRPARTSSQHRRRSCAARARLGARRAAGRRRDAVLLRVLCGGEEGLEAPGGVRPRRHRRRRRAGIGQQCRRADIVHPDADARHSVQPGHGAHDRRHDHPGHRTRPEHRQRAAGSVLGPDRLDVDRQSHADHPQSAADRPVDQDAGHPLLYAVPGDRRVLADRRLHRRKPTFDLYFITFFGLLGYLIYKLDCEPAPLLLGFVLGPMLEEHLRRAMVSSRGSLMIFIERPISAGLLLVTLAALVMLALPAITSKRNEVFVEEE